MAHLFQVGAGSGGMTVLDILSRDERIKHVTLIDPDIYESSNVIRHVFPSSWADGKKAALAGRWLGERRPDIKTQIFICKVQQPMHAKAIDEAIEHSDIGVCAADNEDAKFHFDMLMRRHRKPWTLGEVLSGGIGGFVHWFVPDGPCYGCVASFLRRSVTVDASKPPDYSAPGGPVPETTIPASRASIEVIASLHAQVTLQLLAQGSAYDPGFTSLLFTLEKVPGVFDEAFRTHRFRVPRLENCLICGNSQTPQNLNQAIDDALRRLS
jgi:molybdopterin/thiamine biosynthesis adenylyltransferase